MGRVVLGDVVRQAVETVRPALDAKRHRFDARLPAAEVRMQGDRRGWRR